MRDFLKVKGFGGCYEIRYVYHERVRGEYLDGVEVLGTGVVL